MFTKSQISPHLSPEFLWIMLSISQFLINECHFMFSYQTFCCRSQFLE